MTREIKFRVWDKDKKEMETYPMWNDSICHWWNFHDGYEIMQYTGLTDKNGKEIYEGDIVNVDGRNDPHFCEFVQKDSGGRFQFTHPKKGVWSCFPKPKIEIIGNIYENPNLLSNDK